MPHLDGFELMRQIQDKVNGESWLPILVLTADTNPATRRTALTLGAHDYLTKPLDSMEVLLRVRHLLQTRFQNQLLEQRVRERTDHLEDARLEIVARMEQLEAAQEDTLQRLARAGEFRDDATGRHTLRVGRLSGLLARQVGLPPGQVDSIERAAPLHDVGKIGIPDSILLKPGPLTDAEFAVMKTHTTLGAALLSDGLSAPMNMAESIALTHHERWDGAGYPRGLQGDAIPTAGCIVAVADVYDALTHERPYKRAWSAAEARAEIKAQAGRQFNACVVNAFLALPYGPENSGGCGQGL